MPKKKRMWSNKILVKYALIQVPAIVILVVSLVLIRQWIDFPLYLILGIVALWVAKDIILYPLTWRAYDWDPSGDVNAMVGERAIANERLAPTGYVRVHGELWRAKITGHGSPVEKGKAVQIQGIRGLTLLVQPYIEETGEPK